MVCGNLKKKTQEWSTFDVCVLEQELEIVREEIANHHLKKSNALSIVFRHKKRLNRNLAKQQGVESEEKNI